EKLVEYISSAEKMHKLYAKTLVKAGLDNREIPKIKASSVIDHLITDYPIETSLFHDKLLSFDMTEFEDYCEHLPLISKTRKRFLVNYIEYRRMQMLRKMEGGE